MKILKYMLISIGLILVIAFAVLYFSPDHFSVANSIEINKPADVVYMQLADFKKWEAWDPYMEMEPNAKVTYEGAPASVGEKMSWDGQKVGMGSMTLASATPNQALDMNLDFVKPMKNTGKDNWKIEAMGDKTKVTWTSTGDLNFPMGRMFNFMLDKMVNKPEQHGLETLKKVCEAMPAATAAITDTTATAQAK